MRNVAIGVSTNVRLRVSKPMLLALLFIVSIGPVASTEAQQADPHPVEAASTHAAPGIVDSQAAARPLIKPGDRTCLQSTGRLIPPKKGDCLPVPGRSYSGEELRNTGTIDNAHSLQMLDPSITRGH